MSLVAPPNRYVCCRKAYKVIDSIIELHKVNEWMEIYNMAKSLEVEKEMPRIRVFATIDEDIIKWIDQEVKTARFRNRSHAIEFALRQLIESEKEK